MDGIPHAWKLNPKDAIALQRMLAAQVVRDTPLDLDRIRFVGGVDVSVKGDVSRAAVVLLTFPDLEMVEVATARMPVTFPYISGLLSFREGPVIMAAAEKLSRRPDAYIFDGQGVAHPRRLGIAAHIGLWWDAPTVGCGKTRLVGQHDEPGVEKGSFVSLDYKEETVGVVVRTRSRVKPVYVSVGHRATLETARELVLACCTRYRLPEPVRAAHNLAGDFVA